MSDISCVHPSMPVYQPINNIPSEVISSFHMNHLEGVWETDPNVNESSCKD